MPSTANENNKLKMVGKTCYAVNIVYLTVHLFYLILFAITQMYILMYIVIGVIVFYVISFWPIKKGQYYLYALLCGNIYFAFVSVATIMIGFNSGFHFYLIGLSVVSFFTTYFSKKREIRGSIVWAIVSLTIYLTLFFVTRNNTPYYLAPDWLETTLFIIHAVLVFAFVVFYMVVFLRYAFSLERKIINESRTDELTAINNRYALYDYFETDKDKNKQALAIFDIDDFKNVNDQYGHVTGDFILKRVAEIAVETLGDAFICRYGGEEFVAILNEDNLIVLERLRQSIEKEEFIFHGYNIHITITIGLRSYSKDLSLEKWVELADKKMYEGKNSGKNTIVS